MIRDVKLIEYLPPFVQDYREIQGIMDAENPEFQSIEDESEVIKNNQFITTSNLTGIKRFENILKITPSVNDTLESRISRVLMRWNDVVPYTWNYFIKRLEILCGEGNFKITELLDIYQIEIETHLDLYGQVDELQYLFSYMLPSNIVIVSNNTLSFEMNANAYIAAGSVSCGNFELSNDYKEVYSVEGSAGFYGLDTGCMQCTLSDNFNESYSVDGTALFGGADGGHVECIISDNFQETYSVDGSEIAGTGITFASTEGIN